MSSGDSTEVGEQAEEVMAAWKRNSVDRSLQTARARAQERSDRFVSATIDLMEERGSTEFTVQDVVDRSRMSIRTFYNFFASKEDLLVAVHETILATEVVPRLQQKVEAEEDPVRRIRTFIEGIFELTSKGNRASRALTTYSNRLAETRPGDLERAMKPQIDLVVDLIEAAQSAGRLHSVLAPEVAAHLLHRTVLASVHARILGTDSQVEVSADDVWQFCAGALGIPT
jgi:AcrR family transcriptional regulator